MFFSVGPFLLSRSLTTDTVFLRGSSSLSMGEILRSTTLEEFMVAAEKVARKEEEEEQERQRLRLRRREEEEEEEDERNRHSNVQVLLSHLRGLEYVFFLLFSSYWWRSGWRHRQQTAQDPQPRHAQQPLGGEEATAATS